MRTLICTGLLATILSGCGAEIAYKRGATAEDLKAEKNACLKAVDEKELKKCMEDNGWAVQKLDGSALSDDDLFASASVAKDNRATAPKKNNKAIIKTTENLESNTLDQGAQVSATKKDTVSNSQNKKASLFDTYVIKSWWKMGGGAALLDKNMAECSDKLGKAHLPNKKTFTFTRGFAICMREKGWRGLIEK